MNEQQRGSSVVAFDVYGTLIDPIGVAAEIDRVVAGGHGRELARSWRAKQLEYSFRLTVMQVYRDFRWVTDRALRFAAASTGLELSDETVGHLIDYYDRLPVFPDTLSALGAVRADGHRLAVFSNGSPDMLARVLANSGLGEYLDQQVSVDEVKAFKPAPAAYRYAARTLGVAIGQVTLVSCNAFDVVGAEAAGMRTVWVNRTGATYDTIGAPPGVTITGLADLSDALRAAPGSSTNVQ
ncbi:MAG: haloacid dehalogenase type II [Mycobacterium sp.]|nr:haloacid dehalogenase type II [Mycobacterium sp.]